MYTRKATCEQIKIETFFKTDLFRYKFINSTIFLDFNISYLHFKSKVIFINLCENNIIYNHNNSRVR